MKHEFGTNLSPPTHFLLMPHYDIEQYVLYSLKYHVAAESEAEAIWKVLDEQVAHIEDSLDYVEVAADYGLPADEYPELCQELSTFDITAKDLIPSIRDIQEATVIHAAPVAPFPRLRLLLESDLHGREYFDHYPHFDAMLAAVRRLVQSSIEHAARDGIERTVGIEIISPSDPEDSDDAPNRHVTG